VQLNVWDINQLRNFYPKHPFLIYSFIASESMSIGQKCHDTDKQAWLYPDTRGLPRLGKHQFHIGEKLLLFSFFLKSLDSRTRFAPRTTKVLEVTTLGRTDKHKDK
jgi:hypothetical protein